MVYIDENGALLESVDLTIGYLEDVEWVDHPETPQKGHYEYDELPGGGRLQRYVEEVPYAPAYREVTIQRYIPYSEEELAAMNRNYGAQIEELNATVAEQKAALEAIIGGVADV